MKKLALKIDELAVEAFETAERSEARGTVRGHFTRPWEASCYESCTNIADCLCLSELSQCGTEP